MKKLHIPQVFQASATELPYPDNYFDAVFIGSPYYNPLLIVIVQCYLKRLLFPFVGFKVLHNT